MALLERVATLIRANLNDMVERAENPEKLLKQIILDMQNQFLQVKTQVAIAIADLHLLEKKKKENADKEVEWMHKAELAVDKKQDDLARAALDRALGYKQFTASFDEQIADQHAQVEILKGALQKLDAKIAEAHAKADLLIAQSRRARAMDKATTAQFAVDDRNKVATLDRLKTRIQHAEAVSQARVEIVAGDDIEHRLEMLVKDDQIDKMLAEMKERKALKA
ncbi:MAG TPA: PspA/IM30 family protein [Candidatus Koribacter sp.]|jgi:phage shock protein A